MPSIRRILLLAQLIIFVSISMATQRGPIKPVSAQYEYAALAKSSATPNPGCEDIEKPEPGCNLVGKCTSTGADKCPEGQKCKTKYAGTKVCYFCCPAIPTSTPTPTISCETRCVNYGPTLGGWTCRKRPSGGCTRPPESEYINIQGTNCDCCCSPGSTSTATPTSTPPPGPTATPPPGPTSTPEPTPPTPCASQTDKTKCGESNDCASALPCVPNPDETAGASVCTCQTYCTNITNNCSEIGACPTPQYPPNSTCQLVNELCACVTPAPTSTPDISSGGTMPPAMRVINSSQQCRTTHPPACGGTCEDLNKVCVAKFSKKKNKMVCKCRLENIVEEDDSEE